MTIRFSAALPSVRNAAPRGSGRVPVCHAANDNPRDVRNDPVLRAALRHFAAQGLGAAADARDRALMAFKQGDLAQYRHWLAICTKLDRRLAGSIPARIARN